MKKYKRLFSILLAACLLLTSCSSGGGSGETETSDSSRTAPAVITTAPEVSVTPLVTQSSEQVEEKVKEIPIKSFTAPDGDTLKAEQAASVSVDEESGAYMLTYPNGYMGYAQSVYSDTDANSSLYDFEKGQFDGQAVEAGNSKLEKQEYFDLKQGQVLENGLRVSEAYCVISAWEKGGKTEYEISDSTVSLTGEITLEGILYCRRKENEGVEPYNEVLFYPDPQYSDLIPSPFFSGEPSLITVKDGRSDFAFITSAFPFKLGNIGDIKIDTSSYFSKSDCVRAKVKISNIMVRSVSNYPACFGALNEVNLV